MQLTRRSHSFITIISLLSALGIMVGVAALVCVLSVFNGFSGVVTGILVSFDPHIRISANITSDTSTKSHLRYSKTFKNNSVSSGSKIFCARIEAESRTCALHDSPRRNANGSFAIRY